MRSEIIVADNLTKVFDSFKAVDGVSFSVRKGEVFGFLGPNGAGKTTTINMLTTIMKPTSGKGTVAGFDIVTEAAKVRRRIGVVFQDVTLDRELTGWENLWIHGVIYGVSRQCLKARIHELLKFVELEHWAGKQLKKYSGGMQRRLQVAAALLHAPEVLFLDEPTLGLDPQTRVHIWDHVLRLQRDEGVTIFLTTHYMDEAEKLCHRVAIIDRGKIVAIGAPDELKGRIGAEVVYVRLAESNPEALLRFVDALGRSGSLNEIRILKSGEVSVSVKDASEAIPRVFDAASASRVKVRNITYRRPTLEDIFLHLTGRTLRDEEVDSLETMRLYARRRGGDS